MIGRISNINGNRQLVLDLDFSFILGDGYYGLTSSDTTITLAAYQATSLWASNGTQITSNPNVNYVLNGANVVAYTYQPLLNG
jgi:hypothetical protein